MSRWWATVSIMILLFGLGSSAVSHAQADSSVVHNFPDTLNLRVLFVQKGLQLRIQDQTGSERYFFTPWHRNYVGIGGFLWNIGFNLFLPVSPPVRDRNLRRFDFQGSLFGQNWLIDGIYQNYRGFVRSREPFNMASPTDRLIQNAGVKKIQTTVTYVPSGEKFSLSFPYNQGYQQRKSSGSLLLSADFSYKNIRASNGILPQDEVSIQEQLSLVESYSFTAMVGYGATLIYRKYYLHAFGLTGLGFQRVNYQTTKDNRLFAIEPAYDARGALGRDQGNWYAGIYAASDFTTTDVQNWRFVGRSTQVRIFFGVRFSEPKFLRKIKPKFLQNMKSSPSIPLPFLN
ncbi:MAG: DUF4421 family protein [Tunicatimonas sp.]|uniref:DUF4421 family protein n=1 Tax=Tunicatimonas sp. TaxID=1940096 RepID=UPI003C752D37